MEDGKFTELNIGNLSQSFAKNIINTFYDKIVENPKKQ